MFLDGVSISDDANALNTLRQTANPGFWWYISSHLHGTASPSGPASKTAGPSPMPMSMPMSIPLSMPISMPMSIPMPMSMPGRMQVPGSVSDADDIDVVQRSSTPIASSSRVPASEPSEFSEPIEPVEQSPPRGVSSGSGAGLPSKTLNRFLRGKLLRLPTRIKSKSQIARLSVGYTNGFTLFVSAQRTLTTTLFTFHSFFIILSTVSLTFIDSFIRPYPSFNRLINAENACLLTRIRSLVPFIYLSTICLSICLLACLFVCYLPIYLPKYPFYLFFFFFSFAAELFHNSSKSLVSGIFFLVIFRFYFPSFYFHFFSRVFSFFSNFRYSIYYYM